MNSDEERAPYLPFDGGRFRLMMGLMPLPLAEWLEPDRDFARDLAAKRTLLERRPAEVFAALPEAACASRELLDALVAHLPVHHPELYRRAGDELVNLATGERWRLGEGTPHPLDLAGRLVQEDFCLLQSNRGAYRLTGATLCAPARWLLSEKLGRPLAAIHNPVPGYQEKLAAPVDRFFTVLKPERPVWRLNWSLVDDPEPFQPIRRPASARITAENAGERLWLRVERQTLRRLPASGAVVFTIRTHITRLDRAIRTAEAATELAAALTEMPDANRRYKCVEEVAPALLAWLAAR